MYRRASYGSENPSRIWSSCCSPVRLCVRTNLLSSDNQQPAVSKQRWREYSQPTMRRPASFAGRPASSGWCSACCVYMTRPRFPSRRNAAITRQRVRELRPPRSSPHFSVSLTSYHIPRQSCVRCSHQRQRSAGCNFITHFIYEGQLTNFPTFSFFSFFIKNRVSTVLLLFSAQTRPNLLLYIMFYV